MREDFTYVIGWELNQSRIEKLRWITITLQYFSTDIALDNVSVRNSHQAISCPTRS